MKTKLLALIMLLFTTFSLMAQVTGTVKNSVTLAPIANHMVYLVGDSTSSIYMTTTTNANGAFTFNNVGASNSYTVYTYDCNQAFVSQSFTSTSTVVNLLICVGNPSSSCQASFYSTPDSTNQLIIHFIDNSTGSPISWAWNFGDGTSSTAQNPSHTYASAGTYSVTLSITTANCGDTITNQVVVSTGGNTCQSNFTYTANGNTVTFTDISTGNPTSWAWSFGDGTSSTAQNPTHTYGSAGTYSVSLLIFGQNCQSSSNQTIVLSNGSTNYSVSGNVTAGSNNLDFGLVKIFNTTGVLVNTVSIDSSGNYTFNNIPAGNYIIYAIPAANSVYTTTYAPTYYVNDILWSSATTLTVNANQTAVNIDLALIVPMNGAGSISGNLGTGAKSAVSGATVNLLNNGTLVATSITDANGDYIFNNLADGTYTIWAEIAGKTTTPIVVTLDATNPNSSNNDFIVNNNTVVPKTVSIDNASKSLSIKTFPNPVENQLNIALNIEKSSRVNVEIFNLAGQLISSNSFDLQAGTQTVRINLSNLAKGSYILKVTDHNNSHTQQLITKIR
jgi:PKD repeat protein